MSNSSHLQRGGTHLGVFISLWLVLPRCEATILGVFDLCHVRWFGPTQTGLYKFGCVYPPTQNYYLRKIILKELFSEKLRISRVIPWKRLSFLDILRGQNASKITKNNSQGIIFVIISCQIEGRARWIPWKLKPGFINRVLVAVIFEASKCL